MTIERLKPCPFCGGEAELRIDGEKYRWVVRCQKCSANQGLFISDHDAVEFWNRRSSGMTLEKLREINDVAMKLEDSRHRLDSLNNLFYFLDRYEECCEEELGEVVVVDVYSHGVDFEKEHFMKFLRVEITRLEREIDQLEKQL